MKAENTTQAEKYTVLPDDLAQEMIPLVEDFFTAKAVYAGNATLDITFTNGESFVIAIKKK